jgi:predicted dinucleotide-binding enzyme
MRIGIVGAGNVGTGLGARLAGAGHEIVVSFARTDDKVAQAARAIGGDARPGTPEQAARHGKVVLLATPWGATLDVVDTLAHALADRVVWDTTNPFAPDMSELLIGTTTSAGEEVARHAPGARVVKAIPPFAEVLHGPPTDIGGRLPGVFVCGDDQAARRTVGGLVADAGCEAVDAGPLRLARFTEPLGMLVANLAYAGGLGPRISAVLVQDAP